MKVKVGEHPREDGARKGSEMYRPIPDNEISDSSKAMQWKISVGAGGVKTVGSRSYCSKRHHKSTTSGVSVAFYIQTLHEWSTGQGFIRFGMVRLVENDCGQSSGPRSVH